MMTANPMVDLATIDTDTHFRPKKRKIRMTKIAPNRMIRAFSMPLPPYHIV